MPEHLPKEEFAHNPFATAKNLLRPMKYLGNQEKEQEYFKQLMGHKELQGSPHILEALQKAGKEQLEMLESLRRATSGKPPFMPSMPLVSTAAVPLPAAVPRSQTAVADSMEDQVNKLVANLSRQFGVAFDKLANIKIVDNLPGRSGQSLGQFNTATRDVSLNRPLLENNPQKLKETLHHEMGHAVHRQLGWVEMPVPGAAKRPTMLDAMKGFEKIVDERGDLKGADSGKAEYYKRPEELWANAFKEHSIGKTPSAAVDKLMQSQALPRLPGIPEVPPVMPFESSGLSALGGDGVDLSEVVQLLRDIKEAIDRGNQGGNVHQTSHSPSGSGPVQHQRQTGMPPLAETFEDFSQASPSVSVSTRPGTGGAGGYGAGSRLPARQSLVSGGRGRPAPTRSPADFLEPGIRTGK